MNSSEAPVPPSLHPSRRRERVWLIGTWLILAIIILIWANQNLSVPGLYYDEAIFGGMAKDFLTGRIHGQHMFNHEVANLHGRPFPTFIQTYLGALKSWMLMPALALFGSSTSVLRLTNLCWALLSLLFFMLGTWRWIGLKTAICAGALLAFDPTHFFLGLWDWGAVVPSLLCRAISFYLIVLWWRDQRARYAFFGALFAGLGFFNKVDFAVLLAGVGVGVLCCYGPSLWQRVRARPSVIAFSAAGFFIGAGSMMFHIHRILALPPPAPASTSGEFGEKLRTMLAMYDGSYFYRLMSTGGVFSKMFQDSIGLSSALGLAFISAIVVLLAVKLCHRDARGTSRAATTIVLAVALITIGVFIVPGAVRLHHAVLVYPLPHLVIAIAAVSLWEMASTPKILCAARGLVLTGSLLLLIAQWSMIRKTQSLVRETGGRGRWSESLDRFCREIQHRDDLIIASLDWGFNEQLMFLTDGPKLIEPFWNFGKTLPRMRPEPQYLYLAHAPEYGLLPYGEAYLNAARATEDRIELRPFYDRQNHAAFYTIQFRGP